MNISETYSHFNGLEYLLVRKKKLWEELKTVVSSVDAEKCNITSEKKLYNPNQINKEFKKLFGQKNWKVSHNQTDFMKDRVAVETQIGKHPSVAYDLFAKYLAFYKGDTIDVGIKILPMKSLQKKITSEVTCYEDELTNVIHQKHGVPAVPIVLIGIII